MKHQSLKTMFLLIGICILTYSCTKSVESKVKKYERDGKTIITSSFGHKVTDNYILFSDANGLYFDNLKEVKQILLFNKEYVELMPTTSIDQNKVEIDFQKDKKSFTQQTITDYDIYPIGDWATLLIYNKNSEYEVYNYFKCNNSDTIYLILNDDFEEWHSRYTMFYEPTTSYGINTNKSVENEDIEGDFFCFGLKNWQRMNDEILDQLRVGAPEFYAWLNSGMGMMTKLAYTVKFVVPNEQSINNPTFLSVSFDNLPDCQFSSEDFETGSFSETGGKKILDALVSKFSTELEENAKKETQKLLDQCVDIEKLASELRNEVVAERKYSGKQVLLNLNLSSINRIDSRYTYNQYILDAQYSKITLDETVLIDISCYTDDENFVELSYPHHCILAGELMVNVSSPTDLKFENCELLLY